jgi:hypothetical protein
MAIKLIGGMDIAEYSEVNKCILFLKQKVRDSNIKEEI